MCSNLCKEFSPLVGWLETTNLPPVEFLRFAGATKSSCTPMFTFFMELCRRRRDGRWKVMMKRGLRRRKRGNGLGKVIIYIHIYNYIYIARYVYIYMYIFQRCYSILHDSLSIRKQGHFETINDVCVCVCVYGFLCVQSRVAVCKSSTVFSGLVEYGYDMD